MFVGWEVSAKVQFMFIFGNSCVGWERFAWSEHNSIIVGVKPCIVEGVRHAYCQNYVFNDSHAWILPNFSLKNQSTPKSESIHLPLSNLCSSLFVYIYNSQNFIYPSTT